MGERLTNRQQAILSFIRDCIVDDGRAPTIREMCERFEIRSTNGIRDHIKALITKGYLEKDSMLSRGIRLVENVSHQVGSLPLVGSAPAGYPLTAIENYEGEIAVDKSFLPSAEAFTLRITGDSMRGAGIHDGDIVVVQKQDDANSGEIVVAVIDNEATVKRIYYEKDGALRLQPENDSFSPIMVDPSVVEFYIAGKVVGLMRRFN
jgi:repressor LexA